jgi:ectoine hydroxylase-related dioxygenase (phytanoyl-CoA dioxygenase family)
MLATHNRPSGLWLDDENAIEQLRDRARNDVVLQKVGRELIEVGFIILPKMQDPALIDVARQDYVTFLNQEREEAEKNRDPLGRQFRLANFHLYSDAAMRLAKNEEIMRILDFVFGRTAAVHTSLTFQYSTEQALHRDAPYFHTFPENQFVGVWTAMQDIHPDSGPLSYVPGSHRFKIDQWQIYNNALKSGMDAKTAHGSALHEYQQQIIKRAEGFERKFAVLNKGDIAIWHPQLIHGGSPAVDKSLPRHSMVVHCCPADVYVFIDDVFLQHQEETPPKPYYGYAESMGRKHGEFSTPGFMTSI